MDNDNIWDAYEEGYLDACSDVTNNETDRYYYFNHTANLDIVTRSLKEWDLIELPMTEDDVLDTIMYIKNLPIKKEEL